jgi:hypothetical protein
MARASFEQAGQVRAALHAIVSDPVHGADALSSSQAQANLLQDLMPDAPRETGVLVAAANAGLPGMLRGFMARAGAERREQTCGSIIRAFARHYLSPHQPHDADLFAV